MVTDGFAESRTRAQAIILLGRVFVEGVRVDKPGTLVGDAASLRVEPSNPYVSRGGVKLAGALDGFALDVTGLRCLDVGASTGGFTDCLLQRGALRVLAVDVGYGQLAHKLRVDARVVVRERTNARELAAADMDAVGGLVDLAVVDASFIGLAKLLPALARCTRPAGQLLALVKPQFEVGRAAASRTKGVVRDPVLRADAIARVRADVGRAGFTVVGERDSTLPGPEGNVEAFLLAVRDPRAEGGA